MNRRTLATLRLIALVLPILALGGALWQHEAQLGAATLWRIPVGGYDPRDPLRGRFIQFAYQWDLRGDAGPCERPGACQLCLSREGGRVVATIAAPGAACQHRVNPDLSAMDLRPAFRENEQPAFTSRIFVSESSAPALERQLLNGPMVVVAALTPDGRLVSRRLEPQG